MRLTPTKGVVPWHFSGPQNLTPHSRGGKKSENVRLGSLGPPSKPSQPGSRLGPHWSSWHVLINTPNVIVYRGNIGAKAGCWALIESVTARSRRKARSRHCFGGEWAGSGGGFYGWVGLWDFVKIIPKQRLFKWPPFSCPDQWFKFKLHSTENEISVCWLCLLLSVGFWLRRGSQVLYLTLIPLIIIEVRLKIRFFYSYFHDFYYYLFFHFKNCKNNLGWTTNENV